MEKLIIVGADGFLGQKLTSMMKNRFKIIETTKEGIDGSIRLDITDSKEVENVIEAENPSLLINCASMTNVDACELEPALAMKINGEGPTNLAEVAAKVNAKMIQVSTDYVFSGSLGNYSEDDLPDPINIYGKSKLQGEEQVKEKCPEYIIARVSVLYGYNNPNDKTTFVKWLIEKLKKKESVKIVNDQINNPTFIDDIGNALMELIEGKSIGIYNICGKEAISRYDFAMNISKVFNLDPSYIGKINSSELSWKAKRPLKCSLSLNKLFNEGIQMSDTISGLQQMKTQMEAHL